MIDNSKSQHSSFRLSVLLVMLGICVFFWGLGYKLSLYETQTATIHRIPQAKLLSRDEDRTATEGLPPSLVKAPLLEQGRAYTFLMALLLVCMLLSRASSGQHYLSLPKPWSLQFGVALSAFFLRPPPVF